ncbi:MAG: hypothetical protein WC590_09455 [Burkholderiaceae bacterium]
MKRFLVFSLLAVTLSGCIVVPRGHGGGYHGDRGYYSPPPPSGYYYPSRGGRPYWR